MKQLDPNGVLMVVAGVLLGAAVAAVAIFALNEHNAPDEPPAAPGTPASVARQPSTQPSSVPGPSSTAPATSSAPSTPPAPSSSAPTSSSSTSSSSRSLPPEAVEVAARYVQAFVSTKGKSRAAWMSSLRPLCTSEKARQLALGDPANVPSQKIKGKLRVTAVSTTEPVGTVFVPTTAQGFSVELVQNPDGWKVDQVSVGQPKPTPTDDN